MSFPLGFDCLTGLRRPVTLGLLLILASAAMPGASSPALAATATLVVNGQTGVDSGNCVSAPCSTLQYALDQAATGDTIEIERSVMASDSTATGGAVIPTSIRSLSIVGIGVAPRLTGGLVTMTMGSTISVQSGQTVVISNLEVSFGVAQFGGGIYNGGNLTLDGVLVDDSVATPSTLLCNSTTNFCQGQAGGGGIYNAGSLSILRSAVVSDQVKDVLYTTAPPAGLQLFLQGGGIYNEGSLLVEESSIAENQAPVSAFPVQQDAAGGGIYNLSSDAVVIASTIFGNYAPVGSGIYQGSGIGVPQLALGASLVVGNVGSAAGSECAGAIGAPAPTSLGYNAADSGAGANCGLSQPTDGVQNGGISDEDAPNAYGLSPGQPEDYVIPFGTALGGVLVCPSLDQVLQPRPLPGQVDCSPGAVEPISGIPQSTSPSPPEITSGATATFTVGVQQTFQVTATGSPAPAIFATGTLPPGLTLSPRGLLSGAPGMAAAGSYPITLSAENTVDPSATQQFTLVVDRHPTGLSVTASPNPADAGHQLSFTAAVTGAVQGVEPTGQVTVSAQQQQICTIHLAAGGGSCSGTLASAPATGTVTVSASYSGDQSYLPSTASTVVQYLGLPAVGSPVTLPAATYGTPYQVALVATGGSVPYQWAIGSGAPPGLALTGAQLAGTPEAVGTFQFQVTATDAEGEVATHEETLTVNRQTLSASLLVTPSSSVAGHPVTLSAKITGTGGSTGPVGTVTFSAQGGSLCSAPLAGGAASCSTTKLPVGSGTVTATYSGSTDYAAATAEASDLVVAPLTITTTTLPPGVLGQAYSFPLTASGGTAPLTWTLTGGSLPQGLSLSPAGLISGVPTSAGAQPVTISVRDASSAVPQQTAAQFQLTVGSVTSTPGSAPGGVGGVGGAGGASPPATGAGDGGTGAAVASPGRASAAAAVALSWWDAVGVVVLALLAALGIFVRRRRRAR